MKEQFETLAKQIMTKAQVAYRLAHSHDERARILTNMKSELALTKAAFQVVVGDEFDMCMDMPIHNN